MRTSRAPAGPGRAWSCGRRPGVLFVIPWGEYWISRHDGQGRLGRDHPAANSADIAYLLDQVDRVLVRPVTTDQILGVYGVCGRCWRGSPDETSRLSREHAVVTPVPGLVLVAGGKCTTYRVMAEDAVDAAPRGPRSLPYRPPHRAPAVGGCAALVRRPGIGVELAAAAGLPEPAVARLLRRHGDQVSAVLALARVDPRARPTPGRGAGLGRGGSCTRSRARCAAPRRRAHPPHAGEHPDRPPWRRLRARRWPPSWRGRWAGTRSGPPVRSRALRRRGRRRAGVAADA